MRNPEEIRTAIKRADDAYNDAPVNSLTEAYFLGMCSALDWALGEPEGSDKGGLVFPGITLDEIMEPDLIDTDPEVVGV